ncbi:hypothetical protein GCM10009845_16380 [Pedococcus bigeumensis]
MPWTRATHGRVGPATWLGPDPRQIPPQAVLAQAAAASPVGALDVELWIHLLLCPHPGLSNPQPSPAADPRVEQEPE